MKGVAKAYGANIKPSCTVKISEDIIVINFPEFVFMREGKLIFPILLNII